MQREEILQISDEQNESNLEVEDNIENEQESIEQLIQKYQEDLNTKIRRSFYEDHNNIQRDIEFKQLIKEIDLLASKIIEEPQIQNVFDIFFLKKLVKVSQLQQPWQMKQAVVLLQSVMQRTIISKRLLNLSGIKRVVGDYVIDLINVLLTLRQSFKHTYLELAIQHIMQSVLDQLENSNDQQILSSIKEIRLVAPQYQKENISKLRQYLKGDDQKSKNEFIKQIQIALGQCESQCEQYQLFATDIQDYVQDFLKVIQNDSAKQQIQYLSQLLALYERYIFSSSYTIMMELHNIHETKLYNLKNERQLILNHPFIYYGCAQLLNQVLIHPSELQLQLRVFQIIRRLYDYFPQMSKFLCGPIQLVLRNISTYYVCSVFFFNDKCQQNLSEIKEPTIFLYGLLNHSNQSEEWKQELLNDEHLKGLRENKYYSVKALSYLNDSDQIYNLKNLHIQVMFPCFSTIAAASLLSYSIVVDKPNSIIYWNFKTLDYDLSFGLFKLTKSEQKTSFNDFSRGFRYQ